jgi:hypothetical protein
MPAAYRRAARCLAASSRLERLSSACCALALFTAATRLTMLGATAATGRANTG